ncbi:hypothetical protein LXA43DRAFT_957125 [Ganoderma leucocontextum]|nr:hypothetical protein LXA43DRAFT_957125 [Ganoderma leucocontextum]
MPHRKSPKAALPYLPLEVEEIIIDQLSDNTNALRSCTLTRRSWVTRSQFHLLQAIRIKTRAQLDVLYRHFDANPPRRALVRSVTVAPDSPKERAYLLGIFPHALLTGLPNLRVGTTTRDIS